MYASYISPSWNVRIFRYGLTDFMIMAEVFTGMVTFRGLSENISMMLRILPIYIRVKIYCSLRAAGMIARYTLQREKQV